MSRALQVSCRCASWEWVGPLFHCSSQYQAGRRLLVLTKLRYGTPGALGDSELPPVLAPPGPTQREVMVLQHSALNTKSDLDLGTLQWLCGSACGSWCICCGTVPHACQGSVSVGISEVKNLGSGTQDTRLQQVQYLAQCWALLTRHAASSPPCVWHISCLWRACLTSPHQCRDASAHDAKGFRSASGTGRPLRHPRVTLLPRSSS